MYKETKLRVDVWAMIHEVQEELENIGIKTLRINSVEITKSTRAYGSMKIKRAYGQFIDATMKINIAYADRTDDKDLYNTVVHELIHAIPDAIGDGHGSIFKRYAKIIGEHLGTNITRTSEHASIELPSSKEEYKYVVFCDGCGQTVKRKRKSKLITQVNNYKCGICGSNFQLEVL